MTSILFICLGNICRSATAEAILKKLVSDQGRASEFDIDSAGTIGYHAGSRADSRMRSVASQFGYSLDSIARQIEQSDFQRFDLIVAMDDENFENVSAMDPGGGARVVRMCDYGEVHGFNEVPDPYYGGEQGFHTVIEILEDACTALLHQT